MHLSRHRLLVLFSIALQENVSDKRSSRPEVFCKKDVLRNIAKFTEKHLCQSLFFNKVKKESLTQVFSCGF